MRKLRERVWKTAAVMAAVITLCILLFLIGTILRRGLPQLSAESSGCGDGFAAIRNIFAKR